MAERSPVQKLLWFVWPLLLLGGLLLFRSLTDEQVSAGAKLYQLHCANCHMEAGQGLKALIPPLAGADYVQQHGADMACLIVNGIATPMTINGTTYTQPMPAIEGLDARELTIILNYIRNSWGNEAEELRIAQVEEALAGCGE
ncbi:MAG: cytochrome c [Bacteroidota bacterium]